MAMKQDILHELNLGSRMSLWKYKPCPFVYIYDKIVNLDLCIDSRYVYILYAEYLLHELMVTVGHMVISPATSDAPAVPMLRSDTSLSRMSSILVCML